MNAHDFKLFSVLIVISMLCNGCFTPKLWEATDPNAYVQMKYSDVTEEELKSKGVKYLKDDRTSSFYIEKDSFHKLKGYTWRTLGTPATLVLDAAGIILVIAVAVAADEHLHALDWLLR